MGTTVSMIPEGRALNAFFMEQRPKVTCLLKRDYNLGAEDAEDIFQEASLALYHNIHDGKLKELTASLSTYFVRICINQAMNFIRDKKERIRLDDILPVIRDDEYNEEKVNELTDLCSDSDEIYADYEIHMERLVKQLPDPCEKLLWGFYRDRLSMKEMAAMLAYKSEAVVKVTKMRCINKLKVKFMEIIDK